MDVEFVRETAERLWSDIMRAAAEEERRSNAQQCRHMPRTILNSNSWPTALPNVW